MFGKNSPTDNRRDREARVVAAFRDVLSESDRLRGRIGELNHLSANEFHAVRCVMTANMRGQLLTAGDLRAQMGLGLSAAAITYLVDRMAEAGHIQRETDPSDGRKVILRCTEAAIAVTRRQRTKLAAYTHHAFTELEDEDLAAAQQVFAAMGVALRAYRSGLSEWPTRAAQDEF